MSAHGSEAYAPGARVLAVVGSETRRARVVSQVSDLDAYVVAVTSGPDRGRRITIQGSKLTPNNNRSNRETR